MRYIRTGENKIITYDESAASLNQPIILNYPAIFADTIEDLCDEFVVVARKGDGSHTFVADSKRIATWNASLGEKVYGAIWTDEGLKYVAKMNEKGELELL